MKNITYAIILTMVLSVTAFAANGSMNLLNPGKVNGTELKAGEYKLTWTGQGNTVQVNIVGKGVKMTVPAAVVNDTKTSRNDSVVKSTDGSIQEVHFSGKTLVVKFNGTPEGATGK